MSQLLYTNRSFELLEPYEGKLSHTVLTRESSQKGVDLLDIKEQILNFRRKKGFKASIKEK